MGEAVTCGGSVKNPQLGIEIAARWVRKPLGRFLAFPAVPLPSGPSRSLYDVLCAF
jgi:hypothetical protein